MSGNTKLNTIYDPFRGSVPRFLDLLEHSKKSGLVYMRRLEGFPKVFKLAPTAFVMSHKSSPSNKVSFSGLLSDYALLRGMYHMFVTPPVAPLVGRGHI